MPSEKLRRLGKIGAITGFGFFIFAIVFYVSLPYARFKDFMTSKVAGFGYDMEVKHAGPSLGGGMTLREVTLVSPASGTGKPTRILIDKATLSWSLLSYLFGTNAYGVSAAVFGGDIDVKAKIGKNDTAVKTRASEIDLAEIPWLKNAINLPLAGKLDLKMDLGLPKQRASEAKGTLSWTCTACALGAGKAKLTIASNPLLAEGLGLPKIRLGDFSGKVAIDKGVGRLQNVQLKSQDLEVSVEGEIHLAQPIATSHVDLYVRFKLSDSLLRSSEKLRLRHFRPRIGCGPEGAHPRHSESRERRLSAHLRRFTVAEGQSAAPATDALQIDVLRRHGLSAGRADDQDQELGRRIPWLGSRHHGSGGVVAGCPNRRRQHHHLRLEQRRHHERHASNYRDRDRRRRAGIPRQHPGHPERRSDLSHSGWRYARRRRDRWRITRRRWYQRARRCPG